MKLDWKAVAGAIFFILVLILTLGFIIYLQHQKIGDLQASLNSKTSRPQEALDGGITRGESISTAPGGAAAAAADAGVAVDVITRDGKKVGQHIDHTGVIVVHTDGGAEAGLDASTVVITDAGRRQETFDLAEGMGADAAVPWGKVSYTEQEPHPWSVEVFPRGYSVVVVDTVDEEGNRSEYSKFTVDVQGKQYVVPITTAKSYQDREEPSLRFNLKPFFGGDIGAKANPPVALEVTPVVQLSLLTYGKGQTLPDWTFANLGLGYATQMRSLLFALTPIAYNVGKPLPLLDNLYIGPTVGMDLAKNVVVSFGLRVEL